MKKRLGVGIIGLGKISSRHYEDSVKQLKELELRAVCDIDEKLAKEIAKKERVTYYTNYKDLISDPNIDVVAVCLPNGLHFKTGIEIAQKNKHCVMEKPIALNYADAKKMIAAFKKSRGKLFPVLQVRYNPSVRVLKEYVEKGFLGKILTASVIIRWSRPQKYFEQSGWRGTKKMDGGTLLTQAIHYIDVMQYVLGKVKSVYGKTKNVAHKIETEDIANAIMDLKSGTRTNLEFTICTYPHNLECSLTVLGEKGTIKIGGRAMNECEIWEVKDTPKPVIPSGPNPNVYAGGLYVGSCPNHKSIYQNLIDTVLYKKPSFIKAEDALESIKIIDAIRESSETGKEIILN